MKSDNLFLEALGSQFKAARKKRFPGDRMDDFSKRLNISRATLQKMEKGDLSVRMVTYYQAACLLNLEKSFHDLFKLPLDLFEATS